MKRIPQSLHHFGGSLAEAEHHSRFDRDLRVGDPDPAKKIEGAGIDGLRPDLRIEARHGFQIVVEDVRTGRKDSLQAGCIPPEVGDEDLDAGRGEPGAQGADRFRKRAGATNRQIVTGYRCDDETKFA